MQQIIFIKQEVMLNRKIQLNTLLAYGQQIKLLKYYEKTSENRFYYEIINFKGIHKKGKRSQNYGEAKQIDNNFAD